MTIEGRTHHVSLKLSRAIAPIMPNPYLTIAADIEWCRDAWCLRAQAPSDTELRHGSAVVRRLLVEGTVLVAWKHFCVIGQPKLVGPDLVAIAAYQGLRLEHATALIAGGGRINAVDVSMIGAFRVFNPKTGKGPDDESGFAVLVTHIARDASRPSTPSPFDGLVERSWLFSEYLDAPGAVRKGCLVSRREIVQYFANFAGGVHLDRISKFVRKKTPRFEFISELENRVRADIMDGLFFELLSIGQAIGWSADLQALAARIRAQGES